MVRWSGCSIVISLLLTELSARCAFVGFRRFIWSAFTTEDSGQVQAETRSIGELVSPLHTPSRPYIGQGTTFLCLYNRATYSPAAPSCPPFLIRRDTYPPRKVPAHKLAHLVYHRPLVRHYIAIQKRRFNSCCPSQLCTDRSCNHVPVVRSARYGAFPPL